QGRVPDRGGWPRARRDHDQGRRRRGAGGGARRVPQAGRQGRRQARRQARQGEAAGAGPRPAVRPHALRALPARAAAARDLRRRRAGVPHHLAGQDRDVEPRQLARLQVVTERGPGRRAAKEAMTKQTEPNPEVLREPAEVRYRHQLEALKQTDGDARPPAWKLSPRAVLSYVVGTKKPVKATIDGKAVEVPITRKFFGDDAIVERSIVTLASERALLLVGEPG